MKIIASLTTYPARVNVIHLTIESILDQTLKPDEVILWLAKDEFENINKLPANLIKLTKSELTIKWCDKNLRPFNKLIHSLKEYPDDILITFDDDVIYDKNCIKLLYDGYLKFPNYIQCHRALKITCNKCEILPYNDWIWDIKNIDTVPSYTNFATACSSILYPPHCLYKDVLRDDIFLKLCPLEDDAWFWAMAVLNDTKINVVENNISTSIINDKASQEYALHNDNIDNGGSDRQLKNIMRYYSQIYPKIINYCPEKAHKNVITRYKLFSIPLFKVIEKDDKAKIKLLSFIPIFKKVKSNNKITITLFGFRILTIKKTEYYE